MAADEAQQEPTMEEILASIRKIISEDDDAEPAAAAPVEEDDVLDLEPMEDDFDLAMDEEEPEPDFSEPDFESEDIVAVDEEPDDFMMPEPEPAPAPAPRPNPVVSDMDDRLIEDSVAGFAAGALGKLRGTMPISSDTTLDSLVRELLRPMLKEWLNENLQGIVEAKVEEEVKRISRMSR